MVLKKTGPQMKLHPFVKIIVIVEYRHDFSVELLN